MEYANKFLPFDAFVFLLRIIYEGIFTAKWKVFKGTEQKSGNLWVPMAIDKDSLNAFKSRGSDYTLV